VSNDKITPCSLIGRYNPGMEPERLLSRLAAVVVGLVLFPVIGGELAFLWGKVAGDTGPLTFPVCMALGLAVSALVVWKGPSFIQRGLYVLRAKSPEPFYSCFISGVAATASVGLFMSVPILLLGHTRPEGWDFDRIPPLMAVAFLVGLAYGLPAGMKRRRERKSRPTAAI
jgi:hypothetical protein